MIESIHDLSRPVEVLAGIRGMPGAGRILIVADEKVAESFAAPATALSA